MYSLELRGSVSNNWIKDISDDWFESLWEHRMRRSFELQEIMSYFLLDCQSANQTWHFGSEPTLHSQPGRGWEPGGHCSEIPCTQLCGEPGHMPGMHSTSSSWGYPSPAFQQHAIHVKNWSKLILISLYVLLGNEFWMGQEVGVQRWPLPVLSSHHINHSLISPLHLREGGLGLWHLFLFYFLPSFITFLKLKYLLNLFYYKLSMITGDSVLSSTLARKRSSKVSLFPWCTFEIARYIQ